MSPTVARVCVVPSLVTTLMVWFYNLITMLVAVSVTNFSPKLRYSKEYLAAPGDLTVVVSRDELSKVTFKVRTRGSRHCSCTFT